MVSSDGDEGCKGEKVDEGVTLQKESCKNTDLLLYSVDDVPPWSLCCLLGLQHYLTMVGSTITIPFILTPLLCIEDTDPVRGQLVCTIIFVSGLITLLQTTLGVRLPIVQGGTASFLVPTMAILTTSFPPCADLPWANMTVGERQEEWQVRMREVQGAIAVSSLFQIIVGFSGLIGLLLTWITPLAIVPTITLVGLSLLRVAGRVASHHWGIAFMTMGLIIIFSQFLKNVSLPIPVYTKSKGCSISWIPVFKLFPVLLAVVLSWCLCVVLTLTDALPPHNKARTDLLTGLITDSPWFSLPYPGQWGVPTVSVAGVVGMLAGVLASVIDSIGDYYACARMAGAPPPPTHAVNRGIGVEGLGCMLGGLWGTGNGTSSYGSNIGVIGVTKVGSRRVVQVSGLIMLAFGMLGKVGTIFVTIPEPVMGGVFCVMFGMVAAVGLSTLQYVDLNSSRNLLVLGFSIFMGLAIPEWMRTNPDIINTGLPLLNQILTVLLKTSMFIGGFLGLLLDNTMPGTPEERGLIEWSAHLTTNKQQQQQNSTYDLPFGMQAIRKASWTRYIPFLPTYTGFTTKCCTRK
ncbi:hypothetical protein Pmani_022615 [Petrolisthes manimaculis]|uniref:Solute carrier family 23 member 1 n=1 Tax=Petrolisthes manimaculis TaxID=1843537 RepID=A0AAE1PDZ2_9EUCA|nr:hypothetical protein Pmani_022615 [Petrolisthes manimaculis]